VARVTDFRRPLHDEALPASLLDDGGAAATRRLFDDEIGIDFPAIRAVVDRMRAALLGSDREPVSGQAAISLTPREALDGASVPIELPVRRTCPVCGGRGESWTEPCADCAGSGECSTSQRFTVRVPAGVVDGTRFSVLVAPPHGLPTRIEVTVLVA
jgi:hypothetical protein